MTKSDMVSKLAESAKITKKQADDVFGAFVEMIAGGLKSGERIGLPGIGTFSCVKKAARKGRNPKTGEQIDILAKTAVKFSTSSTLAAVLNGPAKKAAGKAKASAKPAKAAKKKK
jgi:DNA-binding protein HU-beta